MKRTGSRLIAVAVTLAATLLASPTAGAFVLGPGSRPGLAVDAAGTAYIAWNGIEPTDATLHFCRLPRGAKTCAAGVAPMLPTPVSTTSVSRPFIVVSGDRVVVVQYRYPTSGTVVRGLYRFTSTDGGASFAAAELVGSVPFEEAVPGPFDTLSGVPSNGGMFFQNVPLSGAAPVNLDGTSAVGSALLSTTHQNLAAVGLADAATPLAVITNSDDAQVTLHTGAGPLNDAASWSAPVGIGFASYPKLAGGPAGLFLMAGDAGGRLYVRKWDRRNGTGFGPPSTIGLGRAASAHLFQDAAGRLHAAFQRDNADPLRLVHAISDDGVVWRSATIVSQDIGTAGGLEDLRVATAPDHIGVIVWRAGTGAGDIRVAAVGPDAAGGPKPKPTFTATGAARPRGDAHYRITVNGKLVLPRDVDQADGCKGSLQISIKRAGSVIATKTVAIGKHCAFAFAATVTSAQVKSATTLAIRIVFAGNAALAPTVKVGSLAVQR